MEIDVEALRQALIHYYGTAPYPAARMEVIRAEQASAEELIAMAQELGWL